LTLKGRGHENNPINFKMRPKYSIYCF